MAKKILLVGKMLYLMSDPLEKKGYSVVGRAETGDGGIRLARDSDMQKPHLAMIEYKLPDMDGLTVAEKIIQVRPSIAVVLCVNKDLADRREIEEKARALGVRCILHTPYIMDDLFDAAEAALERSLFSKPAFRIFGGRNLKADVRVSRQAPSGAWLEREKRNPRNHILIADSAPFVQK